MTQLTMYPAQGGSKRTTISADVTAIATQVFVADLSVFPIAPNLATIQSDVTIWETCLYTAKSAESGAGYLTITRSGEGHASSGAGAALAWSSGALISRNPTGFDHDRFLANIENMDYTDVGAASATIAAMDIYVYDGATGLGDGTSKVNAFTTIEAAIPVIPQTVAHAVNIIICDSDAEAYTPTALTLQRVCTSGSITIRGEYYWYGVNAATGTGKITLNAADPGYANAAQIAAGDRVTLFHWSGAVNASKPTTSLIDTVASVSGDEVTLTTNTSTSFTTAWSYAISKTNVTLPTGSSGISILTNGLVTLLGLNLGGTPLNSIYVSTIPVNLTIIACDISGFTSAGIMTLVSNVTTSGVSLRSSSASARGISIGSKVGYITGGVLGTRIDLSGVTSTGIYMAIGGGSVPYMHIAAAATGIRAISAGSVATTSLLLNAATTPLNPATSTDPAYIG